MVRPRQRPSSPGSVVKVATGPSVLRGNVRAAADLSKTLRSTLGPLGMEKMIVSKRTRRAIVTDDGALILRAANIRHAAAKIVAGLGDAQASECGDGVAASVLLVGALLRRAEELVSRGVSATSVADGYRIASDLVDRWIREVSKPLSFERGEVKGVIRTAMAGKVPSDWVTPFVDAILSAVRQVARRDDGKLSFSPADILLDVQPDPSLDPVQVLSGILVRSIRAHRDMPPRVERARVMLLQGLLDVPRPRIKAELVLTSPAQLQAVLDRRAGQLEGLAEDLCDIDVNVIACDGWAPVELGSLLARRDIVLLPKVDRPTLRRLAKATGGRVVSQCVGATREDLGHAGLVEECRIGRGKGTRFADCRDSTVVTLLLGRHLPSSLPVLDRAVHNALWTLKAALDAGAVPGGGATETSLARRLRRHAPNVEGREQLAVAAFADALEDIPRALGEGIGADALDLLARIRAAHSKSRDGGAQGLDVMRRRIGSMRRIGILDARSTKAALIRRAAQTAIQILLVDGAIPARRRIREMKDRTVLTPYPQWMRTDEDVRAMAEHEVEMPTFRNMRSRIPQVKLEDITASQ